MVALADLTRAGFIAGDISTVMSPRTVITWAENARIFGDVGFAFRLTFLNKCDEAERSDARRVLPALLRQGICRLRRQARPQGRQAALTQRDGRPMAKDRTPLEELNRRVTATTYAGGVAQGSERHRRRASFPTRKAGGLRCRPLQRGPHHRAGARPAGRGCQPRARRGRFDGAEAAPSRPQDPSAPRAPRRGARAIFEAVEQVRVETAGLEIHGRRRRQLCFVAPSAPTSAADATIKTQGRRAARRRDRADRARAAAGRRTARSRHRNGRHVARRLGDKRRRPRFQKLRDALDNQASLRPRRAPVAPRSSSARRGRGRSDAGRRQARRAGSGERRRSGTRPATARAIRARPRATAPSPSRCERRVRARKARRPPPTRPRPRCRWARATRKSRAAPVRGCRRARSATTARPAVSRLHDEVRRDRRPPRICATPMS
jgi:hypothetical protein